MRLPTDGGVGSVANAIMAVEIGPTVYGLVEADIRRIQNGNEC
jgi:hypothetical protein